MVRRYSRRVAERQRHAEQQHIENQQVARELAQLINQQPRGRQRNRQLRGRRRQQNQPARQPARLINQQPQGRQRNQQLRGRPRQQNQPVSQSVRLMNRQRASRPDQNQQRDKEKVAFAACVICKADSIPNQPTIIDVCGDIACRQCLADLRTRAKEANQLPACPGCNLILEADNSRPFFYLM